MTPEDAADANFIDSCRAHARWQSAGDVFDTDGVLCIGGSNGFPGPYKNCVIRTDVLRRPADVLASAQAFNDTRRRKFSVVVRASRDADLEAHLRAEGFELRSESPCMVLDQRVVVPPAGPGLRIGHFDDLLTVQDAVDVNADAFETLGLPPAEARDMLARTDQLLASDVEGFIAYVDEKPVATALTLFGAGHAGVYWVAVLPEARGRGLAQRVTALASNAGFSRGAPAVTLQASPMGLPVYERMGYRHVDVLRRYRRP